jgi:pilus assembly protein Flp/PilA
MCGGSRRWRGFLARRDYAANKAATERELNRAVRPGRSSNKSCNFTILVVSIATCACHTNFIGFSRENEMFGKFLRDESGATAIEYSLIAGFIALAIIAAVGLTGQRLLELLGSLLSQL